MTSSTIPILSYWRLDINRDSGIPGSKTFIPGSWNDPKVTLKRAWHQNGNHPNWHRETHTINYWETARGKHHGTQDPQSIRRCSRSHCQWVHWLEEARPEKTQQRLAVWWVEHRFSIGFHGFSMSFPWFSMVFLHLLCEFLWFFLRLMLAFYIQNQKTTGVKLRQGTLHGHLLIFVLLEFGVYIIGYVNTGCRRGIGQVCTYR